MRARCALYVDAGYLLASAATRVTGSSLRSGVTVDHRELIAGLIDQAEQVSGLPVLRVNWYDSGGRPGGLPDVEQEAIGLQPRVKVRLGRLSPSGDQKGVDVRLGLDLATQGRAQVVDVMFLVSGDDDLTEAVDEAQSHGVEVVVLGVPGANGKPHGVSRHLQAAADGLVLVDTDLIDAAVQRRRRPEVAAAMNDIATSAVAHETPVEIVGNAHADVEAARADRPAPTPADLARPRAPRPAIPTRREPVAVFSTSSTGSSDLPRFVEEEPDAIDTVCEVAFTTWKQNATPEMVDELLASRPIIPGDIDRALLLDLSARLGQYDLEEHSRHELRARFWEVVDEVLART